MDADVQTRRIGRVPRPVLDILLPDPGIRQRFAYPRNVRDGAQFDVHRYLRVPHVTHGHKLTCNAQGQYGVRSTEDHVADGAGHAGTLPQPPSGQDLIFPGQAGGRGQGRPGWWWLRQQTTEKEIRLWDFV